MPSGVNAAGGGGGGGGGPRIAQAPRARAAPARAIDEKWRVAGMKLPWKLSVGRPMKHGAIGDCSSAIISMHLPVPILKGYAASAAYERPTPPYPVALCPFDPRIDRAEWRHGDERAGDCLLARRAA